MTLKRYNNDLVIKGGQLLQTNQAITIIRNAINNNEVSFTEHILKEGERLDGIAGRVYGDGSLWWIIAAASNIGWWLQVPPGTVLKIPSNLNYFNSFF
jgi:nucleoid-associated protein YgaU